MTFSLVACDLEAGQWGVAVASKFLAVGAVVPWVRADVGAVATQAFANMSFGPDGLALLDGGAGADEVLARLLASDDRPADRQVGIVDSRGTAASHTGSDCMDWAGGITGPCYAAQGNILVGPHVVEAMVETYLETDGALADRLLASLLAGDRAGGDRRGRQSAALQVRARDSGYGGSTDVLIDLRVDDHADPVAELQRLRDIHELLFGRTPREEFLPLTGDLAEEVRALLAGRGHSGDDLHVALEQWVGIENLEERLDPGGAAIDPVVLGVLRRPR
jgi:uncharacterized Ntn-hydrolase superfamily protein